MLSRAILQTWQRNGVQSDALIPERGKDYSHSTYADLIITGLCGISPVFPDGILSIRPLLPAECWDFFMLDGLFLRGHSLTLVFDRDGSRYSLGRGLLLYVDGEEAARSGNDPCRLEVRL